MTIKTKVISKMCEMEEQAIIELIGLTGFNIHAFNLKGKGGAMRRAITRIKEEGYTITEIGSDNALETSYILERYGKIIARRNISVTLKVEKE
jgi:hypothetical protein